MNQNMTSKRARINIDSDASDADRLRLSPDLEEKLGQRYCANKDELFDLLMSGGCVSQVTTFEVTAALLGDQDGWMRVTLDNKHATQNDVKMGIEKLTGNKPSTQALYMFDEHWTGTKASGGSGHTQEQEERALVPEGFIFQGPCKILVTIAEPPALILQGQEEGSARCGAMGVFEKMEGRVVNERGVWQGIGDRQLFLYYANDASWYVNSDKADMEAGVNAGVLAVDSTATTPDEITALEKWKVPVENVHGNVGWLDTLICARICSSTEKDAAVQEMVQQQQQALIQAQQAPTLVAEGLHDDRDFLMGNYTLVEGLVVNGRAVWSKPLGEAMSGFIFYSNTGDWYISDRDAMERQNSQCWARMSSKLLTPDLGQGGWVFVNPASMNYVPRPEFHLDRQ
jgi:hypothetical protein